MAKRRKPKPRSAPNRKGMMPGEYRRRSAVHVERLAQSGEQPIYGDEDLMVTDTYNVYTRRLDNDWTHVVELKGEVFRLPDKVFKQIERHRKSIVAEAAQVRSMERASQLRAQAKEDQEEAAASSELGSSRFSGGFYRNLSGRVDTEDVE